MSLPHPQTRLQTWQVESPNSRGLSEWQSLHLGCLGLHISLFSPMGRLLCVAGIAQNGAIPTVDGLVLNLNLENNSRWTPDFKQETGVL